MEFCKKDDKFLIVNLPEEIDHHSSGMIKTEIMDCVRRQSVRYIIMNFKNTQFMDSSCIGLLMGRYYELKEKQGKICVVGLNKRMKKIYEMSGLKQIIIPYENVEEAKQRVKDQS